MGRSVTLWLTARSAHTHPEKPTGEHAARPSPAASAGCGKADPLNFVSRRQRSPPRDSESLLLD
eukprot:6532263-Prymnesium_polylepis.1